MSQLVNRYVNNIADPEYIFACECKSTTLTRAVPNGRYFATVNGITYSACNGCFHPVSLPEQVYLNKQLGIPLPELKLEDFDDFDF